MNDFEKLLNLILDTELKPTADDPATQDANCIKQYTPPMNAVISNDGITYEIALPGLTKDDIELSADDTNEHVKTLTITRKTDEHIENADNSCYAFKRFARFTGAFTIKLRPARDLSNIKAHMENGVLIIHIPNRIETKPEKTTIAID